MRNAGMKRGSALMIALLMMATLGAVSFTASRLYLSATKTSTNYADSASAYYGAESGLEQALLAYTKNKDVQFGSNCSGFSAEGSDCIVHPDDALTQLSTDPNISMRMTYYENPASKESLCPEAPAKSCVAQDVSSEITIPKGLSTVPTLHWTWNGAPGVMRIVFIDEDIYGDPVPYTNDDDSSIVIDERTQPTGYTSERALSRATTNNYTIRFRPLGGELLYYWITYGSDDTASMINTGRTSIDVTGTFKGVKRQLHAILDNTGNNSRIGLNGLIDYTILSEQDIN